MTTIEILKKARELLSDPARWTQNAYARDVTGRGVPPTSSSATCWCLIGALAAAEGSQCGVSFIAVSEKSKAAVDAFNETHLPIWNDAPDRTHNEVLQRFDEAIARLEAAG